ncbi:hypothetical protein H072_7921 [Dactylellina haptotyla CBS 200.50]|uniref:Uncharacterized protein n=1 Tax=Dactylellina haptotyla (strain CBS 200.50) TaxID=1284197 RepID=S8A6E0_DACHA|nr:hypothetical protein H072_7921 [Dactylellina haptotyla CBS 200.50]
MEWLSQSESPDKIKPWRPCSMVSSGQELGGITTAGEGGDNSKGTSRNTLTDEVRNLEDANC